MRSLWPVSRAVAVAAASALGVAWAQSPSQHQFSMPTGLELDTNASLAVAGVDDVWRWRANPRYSFTRVQGTATWSVSAAANIERSSNRALSADRQDPSFALAYRQQTPRSGWSVDASAAQASTRATELEENGLVSLDRTQTTYSLGWSGQQALTERWTLSGGLNVRDIRYDTLSLVENRTTGVNTALGYNVSERETVSLQASTSRYRPGAGGVPGAARSSSNTGLTLAYNQALSATLDWGARWGVVRVTGVNADTSWQGGVSLNYTGQVFTTSLDAGRNVTSSGQLGGFATNHAVRAALGYALSERTRVGVNVSHTRNVGNSPTRDSASTVGFNTTTELTPFWQAVLSVQQRRASRAAGKASGQVVGVNFIYTNPDW